MANIHKYIEGCSECRFYDLICKHDLEPSCDEVLTYNEKVLNEIEKFTQFNQNTSKIVIDDYNDNLKKMKFKLIKEKTGEYLFFTMKNRYRFNLMSTVFNLEKYYNELTTENRYGKCHDRSFMFVETNKNTFILTGYINGTNMHVLHSVIEINIHGKDYICDWTKNLIISKEDYIDLTDYKIISKDSRKFSWIL